MKKYILIFVLLSGASGFCQQDAWVYFNAKPNAQFYIDNPLDMLSQRAIDRRIAQNIPLDFKDTPIHGPYVIEVEAANGISVMAKSKWLNAVHVRGSVLNIAALLNLPFVSSIDFADDSLDQNLGKNAVSASVIPIAKTSNKLDVQADFDYGNSANQIQMLNGHLPHQQNFTGSGKIIAVIDAGFPGVNSAAPFQRLFDNNLILGGYNFVDRDENIYSRNNHGTLVLSTMGGFAENLVGTAPDAQYYLFISEAIEYENPLEESLWVEAAEMADSLGVDAINTSLGYPSFDNPAYDYSYEERDGMHAFISRGADIAFTRGMVVVISAGNDGQTPDPFTCVPGDAINALTVGAVTATEEYASFSCIGPTVDGRVKPDVVAQGLNATVSGTSGNITTSSGTSFSGPIIAGMVATLWSAVPELTNQQVVDFIRQSSDSFTSPTAQKGYGVPDFASALSAAQLSVKNYSKLTISIAPNPAVNSFDVRLPQQLTSATFTMYNTVGQRVLNQRIDAVNYTVSCSDLSPGMYIYAVESGLGKQSGKFIKR